MRIGIFIMLIVGSLATVAQAQNNTEENCGRECLENYVGRYLDAMMANDHESPIFARNIKFTENGVRLPLGGEGLWWGMSGLGTYEFYVPDIETQQIAFIGTVREGGTDTEEGTPVAIALRLKIVNELITEIEQLVIRPETSLFGDGGNDSPFPETAVGVELMGSPHPVYLEVIPVAERPSREAMIKTANYYFTGLQRNDGQGYYPFTDDCDRMENGMKTTNNPQTDATTGETIVRGCKRQFEESLRGVISRVHDRRFVAVDRERGIVFAFAFFDHEQINWTWQLAELFKIEDGMIRRIEAIFHRSAYGLNSGWSTYELGISDEIQSIR